MYFKDQLGSNAAARGVGPRFRAPEGTLLARRRPDATPVRERDAMQRDRGDRVSFPRDRGGVRDGGDRPDRSQPTTREPDRRGASSGGGGGGGGDRDGGRAAPERRRGGGGGGGGGGWSAPRAPRGGGRGGRAAPSSRGNGGGGGGGHHGNRG